MSELATIHGSAVLLGEVGVLIRGASGSGKSTLAYALLAADPAGARLVADDRVFLRAVNGRLVADAPAALAGLIEVRGLGLLACPHLAPVVIRLVVDLEPADACPRLPEADEIRITIAGVALPHVALPIAAADGPARVRTAIAHFFG
jgi:serine kinase of HPr protein (carbohydrate metabolism regulator)